MMSSGEFATFISSDGGEICIPVEGALRPVAGGTVAVDLPLAELCALAQLFVVPEPPRQRFASWTRLVRAGAQLGIPANTVLELVDDPEIVYSTHLTAAARISRAGEMRLRQLYLAQDSGAEPPPVDVEQLRLIDRMSCEPDLRGATCEAVARIRIGDLAHPLPLDFVPPVMSAEALKQLYPYSEHSVKLDRLRPRERGFQRQQGGVGITAVELDYELLDFPWERLPAGAPPAELAAEAALECAPAELVLAGGGVLRAMYGWRYMTDYDFFLITRSAAAARAAIRRVWLWVKSIAGEHFMMWRTKHAVTFITSNNVYQVVLRLYHSIEQVLVGFDIDCCAIAYTGSNLITIPRGEDAIRSNRILVDPDRESETYAKRLKKYAERGFVLSCPGISSSVLEKLEKRMSNVVRNFVSNDRSRSMIERVLSGGVIRTSDYAECDMPTLSLWDGFGSKEAQFLRNIRNVATTIRLGYRPAAVYTRNIDLLLDTPAAPQIQAGSWATSAEAAEVAHVRAGAPANSIGFVEKHPHGQATGSFCPCPSSFFPKQG